MNKENGPRQENYSQLESLIGRTLSAVVFVQDYLQLQFDGALLTMLVWPTILVGSNVSRFGNAGYRDVLCERIAAIVVDASVLPEKQATITFADGATVVVPIDANSHTGPEVLLYTRDDGPTWAC